MIDKKSQGKKFAAGTAWADAPLSVQGHMSYRPRIYFAKTYRADSVLCRAQTNFKSLSVVFTLQDIEHDNGKIFTAGVEVELAQSNEFLIPLCVAVAAIALGAIGWILINILINNRKGVRK